MEQRDGPAIVPANIAMEMHHVVRMMDVAVWADEAMVMSHVVAIGVVVIMTTGAAQLVVGTAPVLLGTRPSRIPVRQTRMTVIGVMGSGTAKLEVHAAVLLLGV